MSSVRIGQHNRDTAVPASPGGVTAKGEAPSGGVGFALALGAAALAPKDPRGKYYRAAGWVLMGEKYPDAEKFLREYLGAGPMRSTYPSPSDAHYWLGRLYAAQKNVAGAKGEYQEALKLNPKYKKAQEALKQLGAR